MSGNRLLVVCALLSAAGLAAGLAGWSLLFGLCTMTLIALLAFLGLRVRASLPVTIAVTVFGIVFCLLIYLTHALHDPAGPLATFAGFPLGSAVLVYAIGPSGLFLGLLYALAFDKEILPEKRQKDFLDRFGQQK